MAFLCSLLPINAWARDPSLRISPPGSDARKTAQDAGATPFETFLPAFRMIAIMRLLPNQRPSPDVCAPETRLSKATKAPAAVEAQPVGRELCGAPVAYAWRRRR